MRLSIPILCRQLLTGEDALPLCGLEGVQRVFLDKKSDCYEAETAEFFCDFHARQTRRAAVSLGPGFQRFKKLRNAQSPRRRWWSRCPDSSGLVEYKVNKGTFPKEGRGGRREAFALLCGSERLVLEPRSILTSVLHFAVCGNATNEQRTCLRCGRLCSAMASLRFAADPVAVFGRSFPDAANHPNICPFCSHWPDLFWLQVLHLVHFYCWRQIVVGSETHPAACMLCSSRPPYDHMTWSSLRCLESQGCKPSHAKRGTDCESARTCLGFRPVYGP